MSYAQAAGNGNRQAQQKKYFNEKMVTCQSQSVALDKLVDVLHDKKILSQLTAIQKVKYGVMYALASENRKILEDLVVRGLEVDGVHLESKYHKMNLINVYVSNILYGISQLDINTAFCKFGMIKVSRKLKKNFRGVELFTGDWIVSFHRLLIHIPSYVMVRGWLSYVHYDGQSRHVVDVIRVDTFLPTAHKGDRKKANPRISRGIEMMNVLKNQKIWIQMSQT